jgi:hypothetical protein
MTNQPYIDKNGVFQTLEIWDHDIDPRIEESDDRVKLNRVKSAVEVSNHSFEYLYDRYSGSCMKAIMDFQRANEGDRVLRFVECVERANQSLGSARSLTNVVANSDDELVICEFLQGAMWFRFQVVSLIGHADFDLDDDVYEMYGDPDIHMERARNIESSADALLVLLLTQANLSVEIFLAYRECWWAFKQRNVEHKSDIESELELYQQSWYDEEFGGKQDD